MNINHKQANEQIARLEADKARLTDVMKERNELCEKPDNYHRHEALDRTSMIADMVENYLLHHPYIQASEAHTNDVEDALAALHKLYQKIGKEHLRD